MQVRGEDPYDYRLCENSIMLCHTLSGVIVARSGSRRLFLWEADNACDFTACSKSPAFHFTCVNKTTVVTRGVLFAQCGDACCVTLSSSYRFLFRFLQQTHPHYLSLRCSCQPTTSENTGFKMQRLKIQWTFYFKHNHWTRAASPARAQAQTNPFNFPPLSNIDTGAKRLLKKIDGDNTITTCLDFSTPQS